MRTLVAALACRAGGSRLYGKPLQLLDLTRKLSVIEYMIESLKTEPSIAEIVLGVSQGTENEPFHEVASRYGLRSIRGDEIDVLGRLIQCGEASGASDIFRVTTESPFTYLDPLADAWRFHRDNGNDLTAIDGAPEGSSFEIYTMEALRRSHERGESRHRSECCSLYVREHLEEFRIQVLEVPSELQRLDLRLTIDYPEDLVVCRRVYAHLRSQAPRIPLAGIVEFLDARPDLTALVEPYVVPQRLYPVTYRMSRPEPVATRSIRVLRASDDYRAQSHRFIPGGAHTYSKGDDQFPASAPAAMARGRGARVWDIDGNEYVDCAMALGSVSLGHAYGPVLDAVREQLRLGANFQRPAAIELEFAREFVSAVPGAERVKFAKNGSSVTTAAVKLARAFTGRELVAFPGNHAFYSYDDWFIGSTLCHAGIPDAHRALSLTYDSTRPDTLERLFRDHSDRIACVITEPEELIPASSDALREVASLARRYGAVFVADEMVTGYRAGWPGACAAMGILPDLATWGKAIGNGFSFCALTGRADIMDLGGIKQTAAPRVFLASTTHGGEAHAIAAAQAVMRTYQTHDVLGHHRRTVAAVAAGMQASVAAHGLKDLVEVHAAPWRVVTVCRDAGGRPSSGLRTLLLQEMIGRGVLFQGVFLPCFAHTDADVVRITAAFEASCTVYRQALDHGVERFLIGAPTRPVFRKYNGCEQVCPARPCPLEATCRKDA
ncbi:MAG: glutamate-1-semialdehyde 2,1-aminomutase [Nitrospirae bacterium]|nr:glutamate-1-semialdehyde 2,1-aminomutase [Nitrospirota bacterium]